MARTQIAFRLDEEKGTQLKEKVKHEGKSLNVVLERLVDTYLEGKLTDGNSELIAPTDNDAIALLTDKISQLEKQLTPVSELLAVTATDKDKLTDGNSRVTSKGWLASDPSKLTSVSNKVANVNPELADSNQVETVNSRVTSVSDETVPKESKIEKLAKDKTLQRFFAWDDKRRGKQSAIARRIADLLIASGLKKEGYKIKPDQFSRIKTAKKPPKWGNHIYAWKLYHQAWKIHKRL